ncbi:hypothetical protein QYM36_019087 [Artemia franciscana]|uniref:Uncharacterized protein n=1 Tax=Artemia franciscana TaxID=6661 RepID=A0AA88HBF3_ARTSF|nr:hypothetical protein QYM36_019087 [Artemia franciscana]
MEASAKVVKRYAKGAVQIIDERGQVKFTAALFEPQIDGNFYDNSVLPCYLAFAASGTVEADHIIYVNYGSYDDFKYLEDELKISVKGRLVLARYGKFFRGDKVSFHLYQYLQDVKLNPEKVKCLRSTFN